MRNGVFWVWRGKREIGMEFWWRRGMGERDDMSLILIRSWREVQLQKPFLERERGFRAEEVESGE